MNPEHLKLLKKAQALDLSGRPLEASSAYKAFLRKEPGHANAWADYASQLLKLGNLTEAQKACESALKINDSQLAARINLGAVFLRREMFDEAESHFRSVLTLDPRRMDAQLFLAECLLGKQDMVRVRRILVDANRPEAMKGVYSVLQPQHAALWAKFGLMLLQRRKFEEAKEACSTALRIDPRNQLAQSNLASIHMAQGDLLRAESLYRLLLADDPSQDETRLLLITCLTRKGDFEFADQEIATILQQKPDSPSVHKSLVGAYYNWGRWAELRVELERFRKVSPSSALPDWEQSIVDLLFGNMPQSWEHYEARLSLQEDPKKRRTFTQPAWEGEPFEGRTLLLWAEQGFGDTIMCLRYLPMVKALGGRIILEAQPTLLDVAATARGADVVIPWRAPFLPFDLQASLMSLPWIFRTDLSTIPREIPYLDVPKEVPNQLTIEEQLARAQENHRIGLVWAGSPVHGRDFERSLPATALAPLAALSGVSWFSFQLDQEEAPPLPNLISLAHTLKNFSDTAFALCGMDLLITVDTAVAHLAGALGIPTLLLLSFQPDFRWLLGRDDSPWYPTLHLYRQPAYGDWESVIQQVLEDLS